MSNGTLSKVAAKTAAELCQHFKLGDQAQPLLKDGQTPRQLLDALMEKKQHLDAVRLLAYALPKREAVWWALGCAKMVAGANPPPAPAAAALQAIEKWVLEPSEENRRVAQAAAEAAPVGTAAGCAAMAVFWSGGSLSPPNAPVVPPGEYLTAHGVACAIMLAAVQSEPQKAREKYQIFLTQGIDVANGANRWPEKATISPSPAAKPQTPTAPPAKSTAGPPAAKRL
jgi:hypothetical protein